jgi:hypothetical protein
MNTGGIDNVDSTCDTNKKPRIQCGAFSFIVSEVTAVPAPIERIPGQCTGRVHTLTRNPLQKLFFPIVQMNLCEFLPDDRFTAIECFKTAEPRGDNKTRRE